MADEESFIWVEDEKSVDSKFEQNRKHRNQQWEAKITELLQRLVKSNEELKNRVSDLIELISKKQEYTQSEGRQNPDDQILVLRDTLRAHTDWITAVATPVDNSDMVVTASRDNSIIFWKVNKENKTYGVHQRLSTGDDFGYAHDAYVNSDGRLALSASWDAHLLLWDLSTATSKQFLGHTDDVLSVTFSLNNPPHILSASQDCSIKLWDTSGECKYTFEGHTHWVSCVRFSPIENTLFASASLDKTVKIWSLTDCSLIHTLEGHKDYVNAVAISPDGSLCASGGKDAVVMLWDVAEGSWLHSLETTSVIHALCFAPNRFWLCAATEASIQIWDLESKKNVADLKVDLNAESDLVDDGTHIAGLYKVIYCTSLSWSADGSTLFSGYTDGVVRVWSIRH